MIDCFDGSGRVRLLGVIGAVVAVVLLAARVVLRAVSGTGVVLRPHHWFFLVVSVVLFVVQLVLFVRQRSLRKSIRRKLRV